MEERAKSNRSSIARVGAVATERQSQRKAWKQAAHAVLEAMASEDSEALPDQESTRLLVAITRWVIKSRLSHVKVGAWREGLAALRSVCDANDSSLREALSEYVNGDEFLGPSREVRDADERSALAKELNGVLGRLSANIAIPCPESARNTSSFLGLVGKGRRFGVWYHDLVTGRRTTARWRDLPGCTLPNLTIVPR